MPVLSIKQFFFLVRVSAIVNVALSIQNLVMMRKYITLQNQHVSVIRYLDQMLNDRDVEFTEFDIIALQDLGLTFKDREENDASNS